MATTIEDKQIKPINKSRAESKIELYQQLVSNRKNWESYWQSLHDYFYVEAQDSNKSYAPGTELDATYLWDSTTLEAADVFASGFMNYLTPPTSKWFKLRAKDPAKAQNKDVNDYLSAVEEEIYHTLNKSNFYDQSFPSYKGSGVYGTSVLLEEEDIETDARFYNMPLKQVCIVEDAQGRVVEYYIEFEYTAFQAASRWGKENLSKEIQEEVERRDGSKKYPFLLVIAKRNVRDISKDDKRNMPIEALWIDIKAKQTVDEGGYHEFPAMCHRFDKRPFVAWGYSPAMKSLPFARLLNAAAKTGMRTFMKNTDPPVAIPHNAFIMPFNSNPRAINYYKKTAMDGAKDIFAFGNFGNPEVGLQSIEYYSQKVKALMFNDVFLAFNDITKQMNNPEVMERINEKMTLLGPAVGRYTGEMLNPIVIRTIGILFRKGKLPPMPDELIQDPTYEIDYVSQLAQAQKRSELNNMVTGLQMVGQMAQFAPEVLDKVNSDKAVDEVWSITGAPVRVLRDDAEVEEIRANRAEEQAKIQQMQMVGAGAQIGKVAADADLALAKSKESQKK